MNCRAIAWPLFTLLAVAALGQPTQAQEKATVDAYEELTINFTGGKYSDEAFKYRLMKPAQVEAGKTYPLVIFLHGAGERGDDNAKQLKYFPERMAEPAMRKGFPCFVLAPQCREGERWVNTDWGKPDSDPMQPEPTEQMAVALLALERAIKEHPVDESRLYLTGLSMGGYGSWDLAVRFPKRFAAVAPICGGGDERMASRLVGLPLWAFHGDQDQAVPVGRSRSMIEAIRTAGGMPRYSELAGVGHNSWTYAYSNDSGLIPWMFEHKLSAAE